MLKWTPCAAYANDPESPYSVCIGHVYPPAEAWSLVMKYIVLDTISELHKHKGFTLQFTKGYNPQLFMTKTDHRQTWLAYEMIIQTKNRADLVLFKTPSISYTNKTNDASIL